MPTLKSLLAAAAAIALCGHAAAETLQAEVNGMVCAFCVQGIEKNVRALPETQDVYVNLQKRIVAVESKPGTRLAVEKFADAVRHAGYDVVRIDTVPDSPRQLRERYARDEKQ